MISINAAAPGTLNTSLPGAVQPLPTSGFTRRVEAREKARFVGGVMVCLSADVSRFDGLLRKGLEAASDLDARLYLVHVETLSESLRGGTKERLRELLEDAVAAHARTEAVWLRAREPVEAMLNFARGAGIGRIVIGRGRRPSPSYFRRSCYYGLIDRARNVAVEIVGFGRRH